MKLLCVESLDVRHGQLQAVRDACFVVRKGEVVALIGANGAGKTTLLRALAGAHLPHRGRVMLRGEDVTYVAAHRRVRAGIALVPEGRRLFPDMTVEENLLLGEAAARPGSWSLERVFEVFPMLAARRHARALTLSGGEQQATAIGRALMTNPEIILLDEVSLGLSPLMVDRVYDSLRTLIALGLTVLLVEQDLARVMKVAGRAICMLEGGIVLDRPVAELSRDEITDAYFGAHKMAQTASGAAP
jgi:branched-chain amino acid transport system ATP-binding protein